MPDRKNRAHPFLGMRSVRSPLIGRDKEIDIIQDLFDQIAVDQGQILGLVAPAGLGKTRMLLALKELAAQHAIPVYQGTFTTNYQPYEAFRQIVAQITQSDAGTLSRWELSDAEIDYLRLFLEPGAEIERFKDLSETEIQQGLFYSVKKLLFAAAKTPVVFLLEDVHWAGPQSLSLLEYLIDQTETTRMLLVVAHRPDVELSWKRRLNHTDLKLKPLEKIQIERFVRNVLDIDHLDSRVITELARVSQGNPLFLEEMLKHMLGHGHAQVESDADGAKTLLLRSSAEGMPASLQTLIESRVQRLPTGAQEALRRATMLGNIGDTDELAGLLRERLGEEAPESLATLFKEGFLVERSAFPTKTYQFQHDLFFEVCTNTIPLDVRLAYQKDWGDFLRRHHEKDVVHLADRIARHYLASHDEISAIQFALLAGKNALKLYHYSDAVHYLQEAYQRFRRNYIKDLDADQLYMPLLEALLATGKLEESKEILDRWEAERTTSLGNAEPSYLKFLVQYYDQNSDYDKILEITDRVKALREKSEPFAKLFIDLAHSRINAFVYLGKLSHAIHEGLSVLRTCNAPEYQFVRLRIWGRLAYCNKARNRSDVGLDFVEKAENLFTEQLPPLQQVELMFRMKNIYLDLNQYDQCRRIFSQMLEISKNYGLRKAYAETLQARSELLLLMGNFTMGIKDNQLALSESKKLKDYETYFETKLSLLDCLLAIGAKEQALSLWLQREEVIPQYNSWQKIKDVLVQAMIKQISGEHEACVKLYEVGIKYTLESNDHSNYLYSKLQKMRVECEHRLESAATLEREFRQICENESKNISPILLWEQYTTSLCLDTFGISVSEDQDHIDPTACTITDKKQLLYVWKIRWLDAKGRRAEADALREEYRRVRDKIALSIPEEYKLDFLTHPLYRVP